MKSGFSFNKKKRDPIVDDGGDTADLNPNGNSNGVNEEYNVTATETQLLNTSGN